MVERNGWGDPAVRNDRRTLHAVRIWHSPSLRFVHVAKELLLILGPNLHADWSVANVSCATARKGRNV